MAIGRRQFITFIGGAAAWPLEASAQQPKRIRHLGVFQALTADSPEVQPRVAAFVQGLGALNWKEGGNLRIDWRWAGTDPALFERYAAELVALNPEVLLVGGASPLVEALRRQTSTIPVVFVNIFDPVGQGFVESLAHPGGNVTGFSNFDPPMAGKWLEMLTQNTPHVARVMVLYNPATAPYAGLVLSAIEQAARPLTVTVRTAPVNDDSEIEPMIAELARKEHGGLLVLPDIFNLKHRDAIVALAARYRLPAVYPYRFFAKAGGLMSYGIDIVDLYRRSANYVDRILKGAKPSDLPVQAPTKFELVINLKTAKARSVLPSLLTRFLSPTR